MSSGVSSNSNSRSTALSRDGCNLLTPMPRPVGRGRLVGRFSCSIS